MQSPHSLLLLLGRYFRDNPLGWARDAATILNDHITPSKLLFVSNKTFQTNLQESDKASRSFPLF